jgi:hypothetical protein
MGQVPDDMSILDPQPIRIKVGRVGEEVEVLIKELVLKQYNALFKIFGRLLSEVISSGTVDLANMEAAANWKTWLPQIVADAGDDVRNILRIALEVDEDVVDKITMKQLPVVFSAIVEVNGLEQIIAGFQRLSVTVVTEMAKTRVRREQLAQV